MHILITICARGGSKGIPGKNIKIINGIPLIVYTIKLAKKIAESFGVSSRYERPSFLATDSAGKIDTVNHVLLYEEKLANNKFNFILDLDVTSPLRTIEDIENALNLLLNKPDAKNLFSVNPAARNPYFNMVEIKNNKVSLIKKFHKIRYFSRRQSSPKVFDLNGSIYIWKRSRLLKSDSLFSKNTNVYIMPQSKSIDIDSYFDLNLIKYLLKKNINE